MIFRLESTMLKRKVIIYLADLTHTGQLVATNIHPLAIGLIAAYAKAGLGEMVDIELFRYPEDLRAAIERRPPDILGFSNYSWNCNLSYAFAKRVKQRHPKTVIVFGGPNYGLSREEQDQFWQRYPLIDFYVPKEGERATIELIKRLDEYDFDARSLKEEGVALPSCHYVYGDRFVSGELLNRIQDLDEIPSPYIMGLMDKFFDGVLIPMTHTTRGCPFACTFCTEGTSYFNKVTKRTSSAILREELEYIAERTGTVPDLIITDSNFGMFKEDREKAVVIAAIQEKYGWPRHIHVSSGKNQKERVLDVAELLRGTMNVAASLQSTDKAVLVNIRRSNISVEQLNQVGVRGIQSDANTYAEIILGLPGDSHRGHVQSLHDAVNAGLSFLRLYQLIMLYDTEMNTPETRKAFGMRTRFRVMPRCFGTYQIFGETFPSAEVEEICVAQDTLSFEEYLDCREMDLTIEVTHNVHLFRELYGLARHSGVGWFDLLLRFHERRREHGAKLSGVFDDFRENNLKALWDSEEEARTYAQTHLTQYISNEFGVNELFTAKAVAFFLQQDVLREALFSETRGLLEERGQLDEVMSLYLAELKKFGKLRKGDLLNTDDSFEGIFHFDFKAIMEQDFAVDPHDYILDKPITLIFAHSLEQKTMIQGYVRQYTTSLVGLGRILMRAHVKRLFRRVTTPGERLEVDLSTIEHALNI